MPRRSLTVLGLLLACTGSAADHERLGDLAYGQGEFATALEEFRAAAGDDAAVRLQAKLAAAALKVGRFKDAAEAYQRVAEDETRAVEAARGLEQVARAAERAGDNAGLAAAVVGLRQLAPERVTARQIIALVGSGRLPGGEAVGIGPRAVAAAADAAGMDQMLLQYGQALQGTTACSEAIEVYAALLRRTRDPGLRRQGVTGVGACGVRLGEEALLVQRPEVARGWFGRVLAVDSTSEFGRRALVGLGDTRVAAGDLLGAMLAYEDALKPGASDSIVALAHGRMARLGAPGATDST